MILVVLTAGGASSWAKDGDHDDDQKCEQMNCFVPFSLEN